MSPLNVRMLLLALFVATISAAEAQNACAHGKALSLSLSQYTNSSGHTILNGHLEQPAQGAWHLDVDLQTSACGAAQAHSKVITFSLTGSSVKARVPPGYVLREGFGYFRAATHALNWTEARDACAREGAHLAFANSQEEMLMLTRDFNFDIPGSHSSHTRFAWYGASDLAEEGKFITVTGVALVETEFATFAPGQPQGKMTENCIFMNKDDPLLHDGTCPSPLAYICKVSI